MTDNPFDAIRSKVGCLDAAKRYGLTVTRSGFTLCPWHADGHPSLKLYGPGRGCYCFSCNHSADVIGLTAELLGVDRLTAAKTLNDDYSLGLRIGEGERRQETSEQRKERQEHNESKERFKAFLAWVDEAEAKLNLCHRIGWEAVHKKPEEMTEAEALAVRYLPVVEDLADRLASGEMQDAISVYKEREWVTRLCDRVMTSTGRSNGTTQS